MSTGPKIPKCVSSGFPIPKSAEQRVVSSGVSVSQLLVCHASSGLVLNAFLFDLLEGS